MKPANRPVAIRQSESWPTHKAKKRWRRSQRSRIARQGQAARDREANRTN